MKQQDQVEVREIQHDPMIAGVLDRLPEKMAASFSEEQLLSLKAAMGAQRGHRHPFDVRGSFGVGRLRWYYVFLAGRDRRAARRSEGRCNRVALLLFWFIFLFAGLILGVGVLAVLKWSLGVDLLALSAELVGDLAAIRDHSNLAAMPATLAGRAGAMT